MRPAPARLADPCAAACWPLAIAPVESAEAGVPSAGVFNTMTAATGEDAFAAVAAAAWAAAASGLFAAVLSSVWLLSLSSEPGFLPEAGAAASVVAGS